MLEYFQEQGAHPFGDSHSMVGWPCLLQRSSSLTLKSKSPFRELQLRGSALPSESTLHPFFMTARQPTAVRTPACTSHPHPPPPPSTFSPQPNTLNSRNHSAHTTGHTPIQVPSHGGHMATLWKYLNNPLKIFSSELSAMQLYHDRCPASWFPRSALLF